MNRLDGKVAIVTGAGQGMGEAHARRLVAEGAKVLVTDINTAAIQSLAAELGDNALAHQLDVASESGWTAAVAAAEAAFGPVTVLVANAGITGSNCATTDFSVAEYEKVCAINQTAVFLGIRAVVPSMQRAGEGSIVNISSISGIVSIFGTPNVAYAASKFAVRGITKFAAMEFAAQKIRVNSIHPGYIRTQMMTDTLNDEQIVQAAGSVPMHRVGEPDEVASLMVFLASDESAFITGTEHIIDGGITAQ
ncbi:MAG: glucose 1-dehydrogenase [Pseudomonadota bacterium]